MNEIRYRHEHKCRISTAQAVVLRNRLSHLMQFDPHARADGTYFTRSLYFDNDNDLALREKIDGASVREKFRIRYYNMDTSFIRLEKKMKVNRLTAKDSAVITEEECRRLIDGDSSVLLDESRPLFGELYAKMRIRGLKPRTVVDYERLIFISPLGNTRVTLDYHIRSGLRSTDFFNNALATVPTDSVEQSDICILEVKYDDYLPGYIQDAVQLGDLRVEPFSKYASCRRFG